MPTSTQQLIKRQDEILRHMAQFRLMAHGTVTRQKYPERGKRKEGKGAVGPYFLWQGTVKGKRFGKRVSGADAARVEEGIAHRHEFEALCEEYIALSCQLAELVEQGTTSREAVKKGLKSKSSRAGK